MTLGLNEADIRKLVLDFYAHADASAPVSWFLPLIADNFHMVWTPTCEFHGPEGFIEFYRNLTQKMFDRVHVVRDINVQIGEHTADVTFVIHLTAKTWPPPMARALHVDNEANFHWVMEVPPRGNTTVITSYTLTSVRFPKDSIIVEADEVFKDRTFPFGPWGFP